MNGFFTEVILPTLGVLVGSIVLVLGLTALIYVITAPPSCEARWGERGEWSFWAGCMVSTNRGMMPEDMLVPADIGVVVAP